MRLTTIIEQVHRHVVERPDDVFLNLRRSGREKAVTFSDLWSGAQSYAAALERSGASKSSVCIIMLEHGEDLYFAFLGAMLYGAIPAFMPFCTPKQDPVLFWDNHQKLFARIDVGVLITFDTNRDLALQALGGDRPLILQSEVVPLASEADWPENARPASSDVAFLQHSSGTTGLKKGVMLSHDAVMAQLEAYTPTIGFDRDCVIVSWLPVYHDMGLIACLVMPMVIGATVVHLDPFEWVSAPLTLLDAVQERRGTHMWMPNFAFNHLVGNRRKNEIWDLSSLRVISNCSEPCRIESMSRFAEVFSGSGVSPATPQVCYAMAETVFAISQTELGSAVQPLRVSREGLIEDHRMKVPTSPDDERVLASCGRPIADMKVRIDIGDGLNADEGQVGEICVTGPSLYTGYYKLPDVTADKLRGGWHYTGDLGFLWEGQIYVTGRRDDLMIVRGRNFYSHDIEAVINEVPGVHPGRTVTFTIENANLGTAEAVALVEPAEGADLADLRRRLRAAVEDASGLVLGRVKFVTRGSLTKTTSGKISRETNRKRFLEDQLSTLEF